MPGGTPSVAGPPGEQVGDVDGEGARHVRRVRPLTVEGLHLEPAVARLPVEDGQDPPVGVRCDPELSLERRTGDRQRRIAVDVERVWRIFGPLDEVAGFQPERGGQHLQQLPVEVLDLRGVFGHRFSQAGHFSRPDIRHEPGGVAGRLLTPEREGLLQVGLLRIGDLPVEGVRLPATSYPPPPTDARRVRLLGGVGQREEHAGRLTDALLERIVDAVPADQEEPGVLHGTVEPGGECGALLDPGGPPSADVEEWNVRHAHEPHPRRKAKRPKDPPLPYVATVTQPRTLRGNPW